MRELDFTEKNLRNRWLGVNSIWHLIQGETKRFVKRRLERAMQSEVAMRKSHNLLKIARADIFGFSVIIPGLIVFLVFSLTTVAAKATEKLRPGSGKSVETFLTPKGRFDLDAARASGYQGPLDMDGFESVIDPVTGQPIFRPLGTNDTSLRDDPDDIYWDNSISPSIPGVNRIVYAATVYDGLLIIVGQFTIAGDIFANNIAAWDGSSWSPLGSGMGSDYDPYVYTLTVYDNKLIAGGEFTSAGSSLIYSTFLGGGSIDRGNGISVDASGNAYVTGYTYSTDFPTENPYQTDQGAVDAFVTKIYNRHVPIFLVHGLGDNSSTWITMENWLKNNGFNYVYSVNNLVPCGVAEPEETYFSGNAELLSDFIENKVTLLEDSLNAEINSIDIIGHSMGGLIARRYISPQSIGQWPQRQVQNLIMLGTPNKGSNLANIPFAQSLSCPDGPGVNELRISSIKRFNKIYYDNPGTEYYSFWGTRGSSYDCYNGFTHWLLSHPNDGAVSKNSAIWDRKHWLMPGSDPHYGMNHGDDWCHSSSGNNGGDFTYRKDLVFFAEYIRPLLDGAEWSSLGYKSYESDTIQDIPPQFTYGHYGSVLAGQYYTDSCYVEFNDGMAIALMAADSLIAFRIESPTGILYDSTIPPGNSTQIYYTDGLGIRGFYIENAETGYWQWTIDAQNASISPVGFYVTTVVDNSVKIEGSQNLEYPLLGDSLILNLGITDNDIGVLGLSVTAIPICNETDTVSTVTFHDDGLNGDQMADDGIYGAVITNLGSGFVEYKTLATGIAPSGQISRYYSFYALATGYLCGDVNLDFTVNIFDITFLISYLYISGPAPDPLESADVNNDWTINIFDITYLITFLYIEGPEPNCP